MSVLATLFQCDVCDKIHMERTTDPSIFDAGWREGFMKQICPACVDTPQAAAVLAADDAVRQDFIRLVREAKNQPETKVEYAH